MPTTTPKLNVPPGAAEDSPEEQAQRVDADELLNRLAVQLEQLRQALSAQPWQAPALKEISRTLEFACRTAFADRGLCAQLSRAGAGPRPVAFTVRPEGLERAWHLLDRASVRLLQISAR